MRSRFSGVWGATRRGARRHWLAISAVVALVLLVVYGAASLIDEPLRRYTEAKMNRALKGYTARITSLDFHPHGFSLDLEGVVVTQDAHPEPAVLQVDRLSASVHWRALLSGQLVADFEIVRPTVYLNLPQARKEINDPTPVKDRGWQEALEAVYPLKINRLEIRKGDVTYVDTGPFKPLHLRDVALIATNIRNVRSKERTYPSDVRVSANVFESGRLAADGAADFMAEPTPTFRGGVEFEHIELDYFKPITNRYNLAVNHGTLSATADVEYGREMKTVDLKAAAVDGVQVEYVHTARTAVVEAERKAEAKETAKEVSNKPRLLFRIGDLRVTRSTVGYANKATNPPYRVFLSDVDGAVANLSNHEVQGPASAKVTGKFMGSGTALAEAKFSAEKSGPALDASIRIEDVDAPAMNDLFRAYGRFDTVAGAFDFYSELSARDGAITGYVKPLFRDMQVYDPAQDKHKPVVRKMYEKLVSGVSKLLENRRREQVATKTQVSGRIDNPQVSIMETARRLIENAFFKAILPGFDRETSRGGRVAGR
jgi:Domain of Unknown Function (DUF748)